jgi:hypothetical protein
MKHSVHITLGLTLSAVLVASLAGAQTSSPPPGQTSLGDYARKVRKEPDTVKAKPKVFDNDSLPKDDKLSIVGQPAAIAAATPADAGEKTSGPSEGKAAARAENKPKESSKESSEDEQVKKEAAWKEWQSKVTAQKDQIALASRELDVLQREYQLRAAAMYADAGNRIRNSADWDKQDAEYKQKIADKQKAVEDAKQKLADMQEEARKAGVPSSMIE